MSVLVRPATGADSPAAVRIVRAVYDEFGFTWDEADYHADLYDLDGHYLSKGLPFFIAESGGQPVGVIGLDLFDRIAAPPGQLVLIGDRWRVGGADCSMERLYVHPLARRMGVGGRLVSMLIDSARSAGRSTMELWSDKRFVDAHRLYQRFGARVVGERICHDPDQSPEWGLLLEL